MRCPRCSSEDLSVLESRGGPDLIRRRRLCTQCDYRFTTYERIEQSVPMIVKKDGRRELFDPTKLRSGVIKACEKRSVSIEQIDSLIQRIEQQLGQLEEKEVSSRYVGELLMKGLRELDQVAYVRFASVYREFSDVSQFLETLSGLLDTKEKLGRRPIKDVPKARSQSRTSRSKKRSLPARGSKHLSKT